MNTQSTSTGDSMLFEVGIVVSTSSFIALVVLLFIIFRPTIKKSERRLEDVKKKRKETLTLIIRGIKIVIAGQEKWWTSLRTNRKSPVPEQLAHLPEGIKVIKQNTTRPLVKPCPNCQKNVRASATFCPNCGISLAPEGATSKITINLQPYAIEPVSDKLQEIPLTGELYEEVSEIIHIDLMLKVKLYLLWDKAGR
jgi:zinc-ribbon domain